MSDELTDGDDSCLMITRPSSESSTKCPVALSLDMTGMIAAAAANRLLVANSALFSCTRKE